MRASSLRRAATLPVIMALLLLGAGCGADPQPPAPDATPEAPAEPGTVEVAVYLTNDQRGDPCTEVFPRPRTVDADDPLTGALTALLEGPTPQEQDEGYGGWFSEDTAGMLHSVEIVSGTIMVDLADLRPVIPNASTSCGSSALLAQLDSTAMAAADGASGVLYMIDGDQDVFYAWLQLATPGM